LPKQPTTIIDELLAAARGVAAIITGDRRAPGYFDFSQRGLAGSFIAFLLATALSAYAPLIGGDAGSGALPPGRLILTALFLFAIQVGFSALVLRQLNRLDGFVPYLVADNWATFFLTAASSLVTLLGLNGDLIVVVVGIVVLVVEINTARLIVTLSPWQIAMFLVAQLVGVAIGLIIISFFMPMPADVLPPAS